MDKLLTKFFRFEFMTPEDHNTVYVFMSGLTRWQHNVICDFYIEGKDYTFRKYNIDYDFLVNLGVLENEFC